jgi:peptidoglycan/LPS O-acetylase OafA/YrhL
MALNGRRTVPLSASAKRLLQVSAFGGFALFGFICVFCDGRTARGASFMLNAGVLASVALVAFVVLVADSYWVGLLSRRSPSWVGARSYGIYLYHYPLAVVFVQAAMFHGVWHNVAVVTCLVVTLIVAAASYRWIETPFLRLKTRISTSPVPTALPQLAVP